MTKNIEIVHENTLNEEEKVALVKRIYDYMIETDCLDIVTKIVIKVIIIKEVDETYAEVNLENTLGAPIEDYFIL